MADILAVLYGGIMKINSSDPKWEERDRYIQSKGHAAAGLYAALAEKDFFPKDWLETYYQDGGHLMGHVWHKVPGVDVSSGALGHGLSIGCGMAINGKYKKKQYRVFVMLSDGECDEGMNSKEYGKVCLKELDDLIQFETPETIAGMIMDPVPGSNTAYPLPPEGYLQGVRKLCNKYGIVLIFDEVQTGFAKTGKMFACEHWDVTPDIITLGKGFTGGFAPLGAAVMTEKIYKVFKRIGHELRSGSTFGGHTLACAATLANIDIIEKENLVEKAAEMGKYLREGLEKLCKHSIVGDVCGIGMLLAVKLVSDRKTRTPLNPELKVGKWIRERCWQLGMILRNNGDILVIAPSLILSKHEADTLLKKTDQAISDAMKRFKL